MKLETRVGLEGRFHVQLIRHGRVIRDLKFKNLITDVGMDYLGTGTIGNVVSYLGVGTSAVAPTVADVALGAQVGARTNANGGFADVNTGGIAPDWWVGVQRTRLFVEAEANGNLAELGFFSAAAAGTMWCRQLFLDDLGNPVVITKTSDDQLRVTYEWRIYPQLVYSEQIIDVDGTPTTVWNQAINVDSHWPLMRTSFGLNTIGSGQATDDNVLPAPTDDSIGNWANADTSTLGAYVAGTFYRDLIYVWNAGTANFAGGIGCVVGRINISDHTWISTFTPKLDKTALKKLTVNMRIAWARI